MNDWNERSRDERADTRNGDDRLRGIAMAAFHDHEIGVSVDETEAALASVRERIAAGESGTMPPTLRSAAVAGRRSPWLLLGAAAAMIALLAGGLVILADRDRDNRLGPVAQPSLPATQPAPVGTTSVSTSVPDAVVDSASSVPVRGVPQTIEVDAANPPPMIQPVPFAKIPLEPNPEANTMSVAIGDTSVVVRQPATSFVTVIATGDGSDPAPRQVAIADDMFELIVGPGDVLYGLMLGEPPDGSQVPSSRMVAVPLAGDRAGQVVAAVDVDISQYLELPGMSFGHGPDGIVDRVRNVNTTILGYVDETGGPLDWVGDEPPLLTINAFVDGDVEPSLVSVVGTDLAWNLDITVDPANEGTYAGPSAPAPTSNSRVIYFDRIGADTTPDQDFGVNEMPVVAILNPDGSGDWVRLPEEWDVVASDVWGTVLMRTVGDSLEFALLDDALEATPVELPVTTDPPSVDTPSSGEVLAIVEKCVGDFNCTQLADTEDGRMVAYDPTDDTLRVFDAAGQELQFEVPLAEPIVDRFPFLVHVGPDDVAYFTIDTPGIDDPSNDLIAIPLVGPNAGVEMMRYTGLDGSGDSSLIPQKAGLMAVPCCGRREPRPAPDAPLFHYVDGGGARIESDAPRFRLDLGEIGNNLVRINADGSQTFFNLPTVFGSPRDMPQLVATDDGGALGIDYVQLQSGGYSMIVRFRTDWPEFGIDNSDVYILDSEVDGNAAFGPALLERTGTVVIADGRGGFVRRTLDEIGTPGWPGVAEIAPTTGGVDAPGLNDYIAENQPRWAADPSLFAVQLVQAVDANESVQIEFNEATQVLTMTTSGLLDDSTSASRITVQTERADDGLLRFVSGTYGWQCQPGRGHQDFSIEPCT
jgi:hypothetical protein